MTGGGTVTDAVELGRRVDGTARRPVVAVLSVYPSSLAGPRLRSRQFEPYLARAGLEPAWWSLLREDDLPAWFGPSHRSRLATFLTALLRLPALVHLVRRAALVVVLREVVPIGPPVIELLIARCRPLVWDVDDAVWERYPGMSARVPGWLRKTASKYERLCRAATEVWAGSEVLARWCRRHNPHVQFVPTVVDVPPVISTTRREPVVAWIGSRSTGPFVEAVLPDLARVPSSPEVVVVGADVQRPPGLRVDVRAWSPEIEHALLARASVGLYPVDRDHPLADGKCGLKAILYMAHGVVPVVSPTPTNAGIVRDGVDGLHATSTAEWAACVQRLLEDDGFAERCRRAGHARARAVYSLDAWGPRVAARAALLAGAAAPRAPRAPRAAS